MEDIIKCPHCPEEEMVIDKDVIYCPKCGEILPVYWLMDAYEKIKNFLKGK